MFLIYTIKLFEFKYILISKIKSLSKFLEKQKVANKCIFV